MVDKPWEGWELQLSFGGGAARSGDVAARLEQGRAPSAARSGSARVDLEIGWAERVALVGPNGSGKTTLVEPCSGGSPLARRHALGRPRRAWSARSTRRGAVWPATGHAARRRSSGRQRRCSECRTRARCWPSSGSAPTHVHRPAQALSPGERTRAILALLMVTGVNCLVLDEPTNHLDLPAIEQLEQALDGPSTARCCSSPTTGGCSTRCASTAASG